MVVAGSIYPNVNSDRQEGHDEPEKRNPDDYSGFMERVTFLQILFASVRGNYNKEVKLELERGIPLTRIT
jgi:hypothetical protein